MSDIKQKIYQLFTQHPHSANETYCEHLCFAGFGGLKLIFAGIILTIHSIFPFIFVNTASDILKRFVDQIQSRKIDKSL